ncbi:hypothetical protein [Streptococcus cuniculi]|uniref:Uncharacterized protein n=1 Tax=Streptococcus cuniculi TaxID=1432788 RepID=A0A4Y9J8H8_9STRE|nr:hypothetical protein [Streptococcus cuniculi]MBF0778698.1 hypothetical protein [Streptococcus cuniculi]TFU97333.1 hypothetical protein E4T82_08190 [Streptococcus cuniculi]
MCKEWYTTAAGIKQKFEKSDEFENLKFKLKEDGIIFEGDCGGLVTSQLIEHGHFALSELFLEGEEIVDEYEENDYRRYIGHTDFHLGWNYYLYDPDILDFEQAYRMAERNFEDYLL